MPVTEYLTRNAWLYRDDVALVEVNPVNREEHESSWLEFDLVETNPSKLYRREITWKQFNERANRFAHMLMDAGVRKGDKVQGGISIIGRQKAE